MLCILHVMYIVTKKLFYLYFTFIWFENLHSFHSEEYIYRRCLFDKRAVI